MDNRWQEEEQRLWNTVMHPKRRRSNLHSMSPDERAKAITAVEKQRAKDFAAEWAAYDKWIKH